MNFRTGVAALLTAVALAGCTAGDDGSASNDGDTPDSTTASIPSGPAPGVTDDSIKVGVTYVDLDALGDIANLDHGDYLGAYEALFDEINAAGGIHGRVIEPVVVGVNPVGTAPAEAACVELAEDEQVFVVMGFLSGEAVLCPLETHQTAVIGGEMTPQRLERAQVPWFTAEPSADLESDAIRALAEAGELDGTLGVFGGTAEEQQIDEVVLPLLDELGIEPVETAVVTAPPDDITAVNAEIGVFAERFAAAGIDQVLITGQSGLTWAGGNESTDYRPELRITNYNSIQAFANDPAGRDLSILDGTVAGNLFSPSQRIWELPAMQECIGVLEGAGVEVPEPDSLPEDAGALYQAGITACRDVALLRALLEAAGEDLDYGSLVAAVDGLEVDLPTQPEPVTYGPPPAADGDPPAYLFDWDPNELAWVPREG
jgi:hypothetical protein